MWLITSALGSTGSLIVVLSEILIVFLAFGVKEKYLKYLFCLYNPTYSIRNANY